MPEKFDVIVVGAGPAGIAAAYTLAKAGISTVTFIYTNKDSVSIGVGALIDHLLKKRMTPYELLENLKGHPIVRSLIQGGEVKEYLAHMIPEAGYHGIPKLYMAGLLVVGDAAMLVNSFFREGSNLAMISGKLAAEAVIRAKEKGDY